VKSGVVLLLITTVPASAGVVTSSVMCGASLAGQEQTMNGSSWCYFDLGSGGDTAFSYATGGAWGTYGVMAQASATAESPGVGSDGNGAYSQASAQSQEGILPMGSGPGYLDLTVDMAGGNGGDGSDLAGVSFGSFGYECSESQGMVCILTGHLLVIPITLGEQLLLTITASAWGDGIPSYETTTGAFAEADVSFSFTGADGVTPVGWTDPGSIAPEPSAGKLCGLALALIALAARRRLTRTLPL
jgi:hypothetical protein